MLKIYKNLLKSINFDIFARNTNRANITNRDNYGGINFKYNN